MNKLEWLMEFEFRGYKANLDQEATNRFILEVQSPDGRNDYQLFDNREEAVLFFLEECSIIRNAFFEERWANENYTD